MMTNDKHSDNFNDYDKLSENLGDDDDQSSFQPDVTFDAGGFLFEPQLTSIVIVIVDSDGDDNDDEHHNYHNYDQGRRKGDVGPAQLPTRSL